MGQKAGLLLCACSWCSGSLYMFSVLEKHFTVFQSEDGFASRFYSSFTPNVDLTCSFLYKWSMASNTLKNSKLRGRIQGFTNSSRVIDCSGRSSLCGVLFFFVQPVGTEKTHMGHVQQ